MKVENYAGATGKCPDSKDDKFAILVSLPESEYKLRLRIKSLATNV